MPQHEQMKYHKPNEDGSEYKAKEAAEQAASDARVQKAARAAGEVVIDNMDELLDEIDSVLEVNAEEMVRNYVQKGGE